MTAGAPPVAKGLLRSLEPLRLPDTGYFTLTVSYLADQVAACFESLGA